MNLHTFCFDFLKAHKTWSVANFGLSILNYPLELIVISFLTGQLVTRLNNIDTKYNSICFLIIVIAITFAIIESTNYLKDRVDTIYKPIMEREVRLGIIDLIFKKVEINYDNIKSGESLARLLKAPLFISMLFEKINKYAIPFVITFLVVMIYLFYLDVKVGSMSTIAILVYLAIFYLIARSDIPAAKERELAENNLMEIIDDTMNNSMSIITSGKMDDELKRLNQKHDDHDVIFKSQIRNSFLVKWAISILNIFLFGAIVFFTLYFYKQGTLSPAIAITIVTLSIFLLKHLRFLAPRICEAFVWYGSLKETNSFIAETQSNTSPDGKLKDFPITGEIEFKNVFFSYPNSNRLTLKGVSFKIQPQEKVALIGTSGSGKSSIIKLILGFYKPDQGAILINGRDITQINRKYLRSRISIVGQNVKLFNRSVIDNIAYGSEYSKHQIVKQLQSMDIMKVFHNLPNGLESSCGKYGDNLSGGQKQVIYLLRCYFRENPIIILDEPTASIDDKHKEDVLKMIERLSNKSTLLIVSHDASIYNLFQRKIHIHRGNLI